MDVLDLLQLNQGNVQLLEVVPDRKCLFQDLKAERKKAKSLFFMLFRVPMYRKKYNVLFTIYIYE